MSMTPLAADRALVIWGASAIISDLLDAALALKLPCRAVVIDAEPVTGAREVSLQTRLEAYAALSGTHPICMPIADFVPTADDWHCLGPTTPAREGLLQRIRAMHPSLAFPALVHPRAFVSPLASLAEGVFVGAQSTLAAGVRLDRFVFINRAVTVGHDTRVGAFSRLQPGANTGGLCEIGCRVTIGLGANVLERLQIGDDAVIAAGAVVLKDVPPAVMMAGVPAQIKKQLQ